MKIILTLLIFSLSTYVFTQQVPQYSQWFWNLTAINPAFSGLKPCLEAKTLYRNQWANLPGSPNSGFITFCLPLSTKQKRLLSPRQGVGFKFETDKIGSFTMNRFMLNYAAHFNFTPETRLSIGISAGARQFVIDRSKMTTLEADPVINQNASSVAPDAALGFWWNGKNYFLSLSFSELLRDSWPSLSKESRFRAHSYLGAGMRFSGSPGFTVLPYAMLRIPPKGPASLDLNLLFDYRNKIAFGFGFRNSDALNVLAKYKFSEKFSISYSMDYIISNLSSNHLFSHEFGLAFGSCRAINTNKTVCPLF